MRYKSVTWIVRVLRAIHQRGFDYEQSHPLYIAATVSIARIALCCNARRFSVRPTADSTIRARDLPTRPARARARSAFRLVSAPKLPKRRKQAAQKQAECQSASATTFDDKLDRMCAPSLLEIASAAVDSRRMICVKAARAQLFAGERRAAQILARKRRQPFSCCARKCCLLSGGSGDDDGGGGHSRGVLCRRCRVANSHCAFAPCRVESAVATCRLFVGISWHACELAADVRANARSSCVSTGEKSGERRFFCTHESVWRSRDCRPDFKLLSSKISCFAFSFDRKWYSREPENFLASWLRRTMIDRSAWLSNATILARTRSPLARLSSSCVWPSEKKEAAASARAFRTRRKNLRHARRGAAVAAAAACHVLTGRR